jgi:hypothetical protein
MRGPGKQDGGLTRLLPSASYHRNQQRLHGARERVQPGGGQQPEGHGEDGEGGQ